MKKTILALSTVMSMISYSQEKQQLAPSKPVTEAHFGNTIEDKYRNLEDLKDENTLAWYKEQANYTKSVLNAISGKQTLIDKMEDFENRYTESIYSVRILENDTYFYQKTTPKDQVSKLYTRNGLKGKERLIFDPEKYVENSKDVYVINSFSVNKKGNLIAINISKNGGEMSEMIIKDLKTNNILPEKIDKLRFGNANWLKDDKSFIYMQSITADIHDMKAQSDLITKIHIIGTDVFEDKTIFSKKMYPQLSILEEEIPILSYDLNSDKLFLIPYTVNPNFRVLFVNASEINEKSINWKLLCDRSDEIRSFFIRENNIYFITTLNAPNNKIIKSDLNDLNLKNAKTFISEDKDYKIESIVNNKDGIFFTKNKNGIETKLFFINYDGNGLKEIKTPKKAATIRLSVKEEKYSDIWIDIAGWTSSSERYKYDFKTNTFKREQLSTIVEYPEFENFEVEELMITSHDGVKVPLSLIYRKDMKKDGNNPVLIYGYGAYGMSMNPHFNTDHLLWVEQGGILAVAHVRGGGELGKKWHLSGQKTTKSNTWKDAISCTEYLIKEGYTNNTKTAIYSRSAGGIFVGRAITERPDLFAVAIPGVGSMNTSRMAFSPNGPANMAEFGNPEIEEEFNALLEMDSYQNLRKGEKYPAVLTTAGFNDPRIIVWEPAKFAAKLLEYNTSNKPTLLKIDYEAGHFGGASKKQGYEEMADILAFALWQVGHPNFQPKN